jgi:hypothetical protein
VDLAIAAVGLLHLRIPHLAEEEGGLLAVEDGNFLLYNNISIFIHHKSFKN